MKNQTFMYQDKIKSLFIYLLMCSFGHLHGNNSDTVNLLFVYGSKPNAPEESKWFGGIHGGHVSISYNDGYMSFIPTDKIHVFSKKSINSSFTIEKDQYFIFDTTQSRYAIIRIPITARQKEKLDSTIQERYKQAPYDYAFFGYRCASAAYEVLATAGILPYKNKRQTIYGYFYPKLLRKELMTLANNRDWPVIYRAGRTSRKWESDD